jgi:hypothetical protein
LLFLTKAYFLGFVIQLGAGKLGDEGEMNQREERLGRLKPEEKVAIAIDMTDACVRVCASGIKERSPDISDEELLSRLRERLELSKRRRVR